MVQIERRRIRIGNSESNKMNGLIPVTRPIREDNRRARSEAMEVDVMGLPPGEESDSEGECECAALYASGRGGPCYYCAKDGHFLRICLRKAALEEEDGGDAVPEMNVLCEVDSDSEEGLFGLREVGDISDEEAATPSHLMRRRKWRETGMWGASTPHVGRRR